MGEHKVGVMGTVLSVQWLILEDDSVRSRPTGFFDWWLNAIQFLANLVNLLCF